MSIRDRQYYHWFVLWRPRGDNHFARIITVWRKNDTNDEGHELLVKVFWPSSVSQLAFDQDGKWFTSWPIESMVMDLTYLFSLLVCFFLTLHHNCTFLPFWWHLPGRSCFNVLWIVVLLTGNCKSQVLKSDICGLPNVQLQLTIIVLVFERGI